MYFRHLILFLVAWLLRKYYWLDRSTYHSSWLHFPSLAHMDFGKCASFAAPNIAQFCKGKYSIGLPENMVPIHLLFYRIFPVKHMQFGKNPHFQPHLCPVIVGCKFYPARYKYIYIHMIIYILYYILYIGIYIYLSIYTYHFSP